MSNQNERPASKPTDRVSFARITGTDDNGNDILGPAREIGAIWPRKNGRKGGILRFDHIPAELVRHQGVLFITPIEDGREGGGVMPPPSRRLQKGRARAALPENLTTYGTAYLGLAMRKGIPLASKTRHWQQAAGRAGITNLLNEAR